MKPTIGRIVHFHPVCALDSTAPPDTTLPLLTYAALVIDVKEADGITYPVLKIMPPMHDEYWVDCAPGGYERDGVPFSETPKMGCWNWPPRE